MQGEGIKDISVARQVPVWQLKRYNSYQIHSITGEIPDERRAPDEKRSLFREFIVPSYVYFKQRIYWSCVQKEW
ncbi:MAG: hypothetical protein NTV16_02205 [Actinobacteria bacterium]|nr:hypothetical protein [Actinomycetota bacterium]